MQDRRERGMRRHECCVDKMGLIDVGRARPALTYTGIALMILGLCSGGCTHKTDAGNTQGAVAEEGAPHDSSSVSGEDSESHGQAAATVLEKRCTDEGIRPPMAGPYQVLEVTVVVSVRVAGQYTLSGQLLRDGTLISARPSGSSASLSSVAFTADPGETSVTLRFSGADIRASGLDGPYRVELALLDREGGVVSHCEWATRRYEHTDFGE